jgi:hypothetical protein
MGTEDSPIVIYSSDKSGRGIIVLNAGKNSILRYTHFDYLSNSRQNGWELTGSVTFYESPVEFHNCNFFRNVRGDDYLNLIRSDFVLSSCVFKDTFADALDVDFCTGNISNSSFINCGNDAVDASASIVEFRDIQMDGIGDKGLSAGERSNVVVNHITITNAEIAVASKDTSEIKIEDIQIDNGVIGFTAYQKKPEFGPASIQATDVKIENVKIPYLIEQTSSLTAEGRYIKPSRDNVKNILYGVEFGKSSK